LRAGGSALFAAWRTVFPAAFALARAVFTAAFALPRAVFTAAFAARSTLRRAAATFLRVFDVVFFVVAMSASTFTSGANRGRPPPSILAPKN
jgi:hypothetical protein